MVATETKMSARPELVALACLLSFAAPLFSRLSDDAYEAAVADDAWAAFELEAAGLFRDEAKRVRLLSALEPLDPGAYAAFRNEVLVAGMPFSVLPVESLYKRWSEREGNAFGAARGLYLGDSARHMMALYQELELEVPQEFASMPDHLSLELEVLALFLEAGNHAAARTFAAEHLDWLADYDEALAGKAEAVATNELFSDERRLATGRGIAFLRALLVVVEQAIALATCNEAAGAEARVGWAIA